MIASLIKYKKKMVLIVKKTKHGNVAQRKNLQMLCFNAGNMQDSCCSSI